MPQKMLNAEMPRVDFDRLGRTADKLHAIGMAARVLATDPETPLGKIVLSGAILKHKQIPRGGAAQEIVLVRDPTSSLWTLPEVLYQEGSRVPMGQELWRVVKAQTGLRAEWVVGELQPYYSPNSPPGMTSKDAQLTFLVEADSGILAPDNGWNPTKIWATEEDIATNPNIKVTQQVMEIVSQALAFER